MVTAQDAPSPCLGNSELVVGVVNAGGAKANSLQTRPFLESALLPPLPLTSGGTEAYNPAHNSPKARGFAPPGRGRRFPLDFRFLRLAVTPGHHLAIVDADRNYSTTY